MPCADWVHLGRPSLDCRLPVCWLAWLWGPSGTVIFFCPMVWRVRVPVCQGVAPHIRSVFRRAQGEVQRRCPKPRLHVVVGHSQIRFRAPPPCSSFDSMLSSAIPTLSRPRVDFPFRCWCWFRQKCLSLRRRFVVGCFCFVVVVAVWRV